MILTSTIKAATATAAAYPDDRVLQKKGINVLYILFVQLLALVIFCCYCWLLFGWNNQLFKVIKIIIEEQNYKA